MDIQNALWKLHALGDCSVLDQGSREAAKLAAEVLNTVCNLIDMGSGEDLAAISAIVRILSGRAASAEDKAMRIDTLAQDNAHRAELVYDVSKVQEMLRSSEPVGPVLGEFLHQEHRWAFNDTELLCWNAEDQDFEMYGIHGLAEPTKESVTALINTL